jgi:hypothetical protein
MGQLNTFHLRDIMYTLSETKTKLCGFSPQANYTDRAAKLVPTFADRGCRVVSATDPHGR